MTHGPRRHSLSLRFRRLGDHLGHLEEAVLNASQHAVKHACLL